jgi:hypothetical protein
MCLITQVTSLDTTSMLLKRFPQSGFFSFGNKSKCGGLSPPDFDFFPKIYGSSATNFQRFLLQLKLKKLRMCAL